MVAAALMSTGPMAHADVRTYNKVLIISDYFSGMPQITYYGSENADTVSVSVGDDNIVFTSSSTVTVDNSNYSSYNCTGTGTTTVTCAAHVQTPSNLLKVEHVGVVTWGGADSVTATGQGSVYGTSGFRPIQLNVGSWEGDDVITTGGYSMVTAGPGNDTITSGAGPAAGSGFQFKDSVDGGDGNDLIDVSITPSPDMDTVTCGAGNDTVHKSASDTVAPNCEAVS